ncbi:MAG TPA: hypothetical protein VIU65_03350 [Pyrinomonadaceae bacterium]
MDIEANLLKRLRIAARRKGVTVKEYLAVVLERGLEDQPVKRGRLRLPAFSMGRSAPSVNLDKSMRLSAEMEDVETARELTLRK